MNVAHPFGALVPYFIAETKHCTLKVKIPEFGWNCRASTSQPSTGDYLYEPAFGLPIVRRKVEYGDLLREIRQNRVRHIAYFDNNTAPPENAAPSTQTNLELEGYCLVVYNDDTVAQVFHAQDLLDCPYLPARFLLTSLRSLTTTSSMQLYLFPQLGLRETLY